ncbi:amino acid adenylation domain-containing protein [Kitasatospora sp. NPDC056138]|uniref:amino acid adenylation domain-containing protein n=1 Tax=Kitasatospora sp. NPDC056138 TaxID=3345724 RepID=UPI0035E31806
MHSVPDSARAGQPAPAPAQRQRSADEVADIVLDLLHELLPAGTEVSGTVPLSSLGLSSLAAARLVMELENRLGVEVPLRLLGDCHDPGELARRLAALVPDGRAPAAPVVRARPAERGDPFPLTPIQQAYTVGKYVELGPDAVGCHQYLEFGVEGLDDTGVARLRAAWRRVVEHHGMLRSTVSGGVLQRVSEDAPPEGMTVRQAESPEEFEARVAEARQRLSHHRYPPGAWPAYRIEVTRTADGRAVVHFSVDAMLTDGHGLEVLLDDWWHWYRDPGWEPEPVPFSVRDCVLALARHRTTPAYRADAEYWTRRLAELPPGPRVLASAAATRPDGPDCFLRTPRTGRLDAKDWQALREGALDWGVSPTSLVLTVFTEVLGGADPDGPLTLVLTASDRLRLPAAADRLVGPFTSTVVFVTEARPTTADAARTVHRLLWEDLGHAAVSGIEALRERRPGEQLPVVFTSMVDTSRPDRPVGSFADGIRYAVSQTSGVALDHQMWERDGGLDFRWDVAERLFADGLADRLFAAFEAALRRVAGAERVTGMVGEEALVRPLNALQQSYLVARAGGGPDGEGCQVHQSFRLPGLDHDRLEAAWLRLVREHDVLRSTVTPDGRLLTAAQAPPWHLPVTGPGAAAVPADLGTGPSTRPFPPDADRLWELTATVEDTGAAEVHLTVDLLVADARSITLLGRDLMRLYADPGAAPRRGLPAGAPVPGADDAASLAEAEAHWRERVAELPSGPPVEPGRGPRLRLELRLDRAPLADRAARLGTGLDALLLAAFTEALTGHWPEPFAVPVVRWSASREPARPAELTALSWVVAPGGDPSAEAAAVRYQRTLDEDAAMDAADGLVQLRARAMRLRRSGSFAHPVVYTCVLDLGADPLPPGVEAGPWRTATPGVALDCVTVDDGRVLEIGWDAAADAFPEGRLVELFARFRAALAVPESVAAAAGSGLPAAAAGGPGVGAAVGAAEGVPGGPGAGAAEAERRRLLYDWNDTAADYPDDRPVQCLFEDRAAEQPEAVALRWRGGTMTYREVNRRANLLARRLRGLGVGPEVPVAISVRRGPGMAVAVLGVLKAGGVYLPVEPSLPAARARGMVADGGAAVVVTDGSRGDWPGPHGLRQVDLDEVVRAGDGDDPGNLPPLNSADSTAYFIFTSGSTGRPKCVAVAHRPVLNLLNWCYRTFGFGPEDTGLCVTSLGFDLSVFDILGLLGRGAGLYLADEAEQRDPALLARVLVAEPITFWNSAPTTLAQLAPLLAEFTGHPGTADLRLVFLSGDYTPLPLPDRVRAVFPRAEIVSLGGATEATVWSNWFRVGEIDPEWRSIPYGRPIDNARYYVLDERFEPCPVGVAGDLYIAGPCLSLGYHGQRELTAERFPADPFRPGSGERMYRTGDRACHLPDGNLCFLGRADGQVKIRGHRVELGEIEHRLRLHAAVQDAVVLARPDSTGDRKLVAYLVAADGTAIPSVRELRDFAGETLPGYMVPNFLAFVPGYPASPNGKLDRAALPWPLDAPGAVPVDTGAPTAAGEPAAGGRAAAPIAEEIRGLLAGLLGVASVDPDQDLWDQGVTSFTMVQLSAALQERHGQRIPVSALLADPTVSEIARQVAALLLGAAGPAAPPVVERAAGGPSEPDPGQAEEGSAAGTGPAPAETGPVATAPAEVDFFSPEQRREFKAAQWQLRPERPDEHLFALTAVEIPEEQYAARASRRDFVPEPVPAEALGGLLALLRRDERGGRPRHLYPSAGDTYAVQVYLHVRPGGVAGLPEGVYYYRPDRHVLQRVAEVSGIDRNAHFFYNRPVFDAAGFEIYLIGQPKGIEPLYGELAGEFLTLEAGYVGQLLMSGQAAAGIGLCPVGTMRFDAVREHFRLDAGQRFLHAFIGGAVAPEAPAAPASGEALAAPAAGEAPAAPASDEATTAPAPAEATTGALRSARSSAGAGNGGRAAEVAVIGMAGRYPDAAGLDGFWRNLSTGRRSVRPLPAGRAAALAAARGAAADRPFPDGGYLQGPDGFDSLLFRISPQEAATLDPQLKAVLQVVWECLENAGHTAASLRRTGGRVGVFVGVMWHDHRQTGADRHRAGGPAEFAAAASDIPNRISHVFDFQGPSVAVDTSCSSSLAALHLAVQSLRLGECDAAVVAGVNLITHPYHLDLLADLGLLAEHGTAGAFDGAASGWSPGEGAGAVLLRPAEPAARDGDLVHAVIEASAIGHAGRSGRYGAPRSQALAASVERLLAGSGLCPSDIGYAECAAAGASIADAAEVEALATVFDGDGRDRPLPVGTLKPNIGHLESAAGLSQLAKVVLQLKHGMLAPTLVADQPAPLVDWGCLPLRLVDRPTPWDGADGVVRRALINALGASGTYGHLVVRSGGPGAREDGGDGQPLAD